MLSDITRALYRKIPPLVGLRVADATKTAAMHNFLTRVCSCNGHDYTQSDRSFLYNRINLRIDSGIVWDYFFDDEMTEKMSKPFSSPV